jgi:hypothetical protein
VAVQAPFTTAAFSVMLLGPLHVLLAVRYLSGRIAGALPGSTGWLLVAFVAVMALIRAVSSVAPHLGHQLELVGGMAGIGVALMVGLRGRLRWWALAAVAAIAVWSLIELPWYWHLFVHGHNLVPLIFLWDWTRGRPPGQRWGFVGVNLVWLAGVPAAILAGLADPLLNGEPPAIVTGLVDPAALVASASPPGADPALGLRFLAVFAFGQAMHYVLWMVFFQLYGRAEVRRSPLPAGWRFWALAGGASALVWAAYAAGYYDGRTAYAVLGALNVYLEQPIATWLLLTALPASATTALVGRLRE